MNDWEVDSYKDLMKGLSEAIPHFEEDDRIGWEWEDRDYLSVISFYAILAKEKVDLVLTPERERERESHRRVYVTVQFHLELSSLHGEFIGEAYRPLIIRTEGG